MNSNIPSMGAANEKLTRNADKWWSDMAAVQNLDLTGFDPDAAFETRVAWAISKGYEIGTIYSRFSTKLQHSTDDQVRENIQWAAKNRIYVPPELISVDEGVKGKRIQRAGLDRTKAILHERLAKVLLVYKASRLFRQAGKGYQFIILPVSKSYLVNIGKNLVDVDDYFVQIGGVGVRVVGRKNLIVYVNQMCICVWRNIHHV